MEISISNIAWLPGEETEMARLLPTLKIKAVEVAPARILPDLESYYDIWARNGVRISSMQALLFQREDLVLFETEEKRRQTLDYLFGIIETAERIGATKLVFGAPKNRRRGNKSIEDVLPAAIGFFRSLGEKAESHGIAVCIEANPAAYGADFIVTTDEAAKLVKEVDSAGFKLHLDTGAMIINRENFRSVIESHYEIIKHVHLSAPFLAPIYQNELPLREIIESLAATDYQGFLTIEMKATGEKENRDHVCRAIEFAREAAL